MIQGDKFIWLKKEVVAEHEFVNLPGFRSIINKDNLVANIIK
jgi:hypothetical protein